MWMPFWINMFYMYLIISIIYAYIYILYMIYVNTCLRLDKSFLQHLLLWNPTNYVEYLRIFQCHPFCSKHHGTSMAPNVPVRNDVVTPGRHLDTKKVPAHLCVGDSVQNFLPENFGTWRVSYLNSWSPEYLNPSSIKMLTSFWKVSELRQQFVLGPFKRKKINAEHLGGGLGYQTWKNSGMLWEGQE